jgi:hypothetical protein
VFTPLHLEFRFHRPLRVRGGRAHDKANGSLQSLPQGDVCAAMLFLVLTRTAFKCDVLLIMMMVLELLLM